MTRTVSGVMESMAHATSRPARLQFGPALAPCARAVRGAVRAEPEAAEEEAQKSAPANPGGWAATRRTGPSPCWHSTVSGALVAILQENACLTVLTWNQFVPRLGEFGRARMPRKRGG